MSRGLWFVAGAGLGVYAMNRARKAAESLTVEGLRSRWQGFQHAARLLNEDVRQAQSDREQELRETLGLRPLSSADGPPELTGGAADERSRLSLLPPDDRKDTD